MCHSSYHREPALLEQSLTIRHQERRNVLFEVLVVMFPVVH